MAEQVAGALLMAAGVALVTWALVAELADATPSTWYERRPVLIASALACILLGGVLVAD